MTRSVGAAAAFGARILLMCWDCRTVSHLPHLQPLTLVVSEQAASHVIFTRRVIASLSYTLPLMTTLLLLLGSSANDLNVTNTSSACVCMDKKKLGRPRTHDTSAAACW